MTGALDPSTAGGGSRVWFAGHSLGAAVATLAAARWHLRAPERPKTLYTFAPPRVGDAAFAAVCEEGFPVFRYVHDRDMVARVPPTVDPLGLTYRDIGREPVYFRDDGSPAPATDFLTELRRAAPDAALKAARMVLSGKAFAAFRGGWRAIAEALAEGAPQALVDHAPIYYINYFKAQLA